MDRLTDDADDIVICSFSRERAWRSGMLQREKNENQQQRDRIDWCKREGDWCDTEAARRRGSEGG